MPVHYDPARIRKRFCPRGHDKYVVGVINCPSTVGKCYRCHLDKTNRGWQNPLRAIQQAQHRIRKRRGHKVQQIQELLQELKGETNG